MWPPSPMASDPEVGRHPCLRERRKGHVSHLSTFPVGCRPWPLTPLLPSLCTQASWPSALSQAYLEPFPLDIPVLALFLPPGPTSHCHSCWDGFQGRGGTLSHPLDQTPLVRGRGSGRADGQLAGHLRPWGLSSAVGPGAASLCRESSLAGDLWGLWSWSSGSESLPLRLRGTLRSGLTMLS